MAKTRFDRRSALKLMGGAGAAGLAPRAFPSPAIAQGAPVKVGFMLPYTGTYAPLAKNIDQAFRQYVAEKGDKLGGRAVEYVMVDDQADPSKATDNMNKLVDRDKVDVVVGTVHSGVQMAMVKIARETGKLMIIPNAGADGRRARRARPTSSAPRSRTGSRATRWAR